MESNPLTLYLKSKAETDALSEEFAKYLGCGWEDTACLHNKTADEIVTAENAVIKINPIGPIQVFMPWQPTADGTYITGQPMIEFPAGRYNRVPFMLGTVDQEALIFLYTALPNGLTPKQYREIIYFVFRGAAPKVLKMYPVAENVTDARPQFTVLGTDYIWACSHRNVSRYMSQYAPLWRWHFDHVMSFDPWGPDYQECADAVCHGSELPFVFNTPSFSFELGYNYSFTQQELVLSNQISTQFGNFATTHSPNNGPSIQALFWPQFTTANDYDIKWQTPASYIESGYRKAQCDFWDTIGYFYGNTLVDHTIAVGLQSQKSQ